MFEKIVSIVTTGLVVVGVPLVLLSFGVAIYGTIRRLRSNLRGTMKDWVGTAFGMAIFLGVALTLGWASCKSGVFCVNAERSK